MDISLITVFLASIGISALASSIGCFIVWKKMAYFGDSLSHSILLGIIISLCFSISPIIGALIISIMIAIIIGTIDSKYSKDSALGIIAHICLSLTIIINSYKNNRFNLDQYLFGDILTVSYSEILIIYILLTIVTIWLIFRWRGLLLITIAKELAYTEQINAKRIRLELILLIALVIAIAIKIIGALLINALLIIPPNSANIIAKSPLTMMVYSAVIGVSSSIIGIGFSFYVDIPTGAAIIVSSGLMLIILNLYRVIKK